MTRHDLDIALRLFEPTMLLRLCSMYGIPCDQEVIAELGEYLRPKLPAGIMLADVVPRAGGIDLLVIGGVRVRVSIDFDWRRLAVGNRIEIEDEA